MRDRGAGIWVPAGRVAELRERETQQQLLFLNILYQAAAG